MSGSPVETLQKALNLYLIVTRGLISLWQLERHTEFSASKFDDTWPFLNIFRNPNVTVPTRKWPSVSSLTSRSVHIVLPSLVKIHIYRNSTGVLTLLYKHEFWMAIPAVTRKYTPGSWRNSRNNMRLPPLPEMRMDFIALRAQQFHVPNQTR